jgi:fatty acid desaturase
MHLLFLLPIAACLVGVACGLYEVVADIGPVESDHGIWLMLACAGLALTTAAVGLGLSGHTILTISCGALTVPIWLAWLWWHHRLIQLLEMIPIRYWTRSQKYLAKRLYH